jgi:hypothetical protein
MRSIIMGIDFMIVSVSLLNVFVVMSSMVVSPIAASIWKGIR